MRALLQVQHNDYQMMCNPPVGNRGSCYPSEQAPMASCWVSHQYV